MTFEEWWESEIPTPPMPEIGLYPTSPTTKRRIYYGCSTHAAKEIWDAAREEASESIEMLQDEVVLLDTRNRELHAQNDALKAGRNQ